MAGEVKPGVYQHFKGRHYLVIGLARHSETGETMVVYKPLYEHDGPEYAVRPQAMFEEEINGVKRFALLDQSARQQAAEHAVWAGIVLPRSDKAPS